MSQQSSILDTFNLLFKSLTWPVCLRPRTRTMVVCSFDTLLFFVCALWCAYSLNVQAAPSKRAADTFAYPAKLPPAEPFHFVTRVSCVAQELYMSIKRTKTSLNFVGISTCTRLVQFFNVNRVPDGQPDSLASACKPVVCTRDTRVSLY